MAKICASYGKPKLEGFEEQPNLEMISLSNVIHCKHIRVEEVEEGLYEITCDKKYVDTGSGVLHIPGDPKSFAQKLGNLDNLQYTNIPPEILKQLSRGEPEGVHSPQYLIKSMPSIGEYRAPSDCWDYEERTDAVTLIPKEGIVKLCFRHPSGRTQVWEVNPDAKNVSEMYKFLESESINF